MKWKNWQKLLNILLMVALIFALNIPISATEGNVAKIGDTEYATLAAAVNAAKSGDTVVLLKNATFEGVDFGSKDITVTATSKDIQLAWTYGYNQFVGGTGNNITFKDITLVKQNQVANSGFGGHPSSVTYAGCNINGEWWLYENTATFVDCVFTQHKGTDNKYALYNYGAKITKIINCTFNVEGKAIKTDTDGDIPLTLYIKDCTFNSDRVNKCAVMLDTRASIHNVIISDCTFNKNYTNGCEGGEAYCWDEYSDTAFYANPAGKGARVAIGTGAEIDSYGRLTAGTFTRFDTVSGEMKLTSDLIAGGYKAVKNDNGSYTIEKIIVTPDNAQDVLDNAKEGQVIELTKGDYGILYLRNQNGAAGSNRILKDVTIKVAEDAAVTVDTIRFERINQKYLDIENLTIDGIAFDDPHKTAVWFDYNSECSLRVNGLTIQNCTKTGDLTQGSGYEYHGFAAFCYDAETQSSTVYAGNAELTCGYHNIVIKNNTISNIIMPIRFANNDYKDGLTVTGNTFTNCYDNLIQLSGGNNSGNYVFINNTVKNIQGRFARIAGLTANATVTVSGNKIVNPVSYDIGGDGTVFKVSGAAGFTVTESDNQWKAGSFNDAGTTWCSMGATKVAVNTTTNTEYTDLHEALAACTAGQTVELVANVDLTGKPWTPITGFNGTFDGNNKTITGLTVSGAGNVGLFASTGTSAVIKDLTISDATITATGSNSGVLAGSISGSKVENVTITGCTVNGNAYVGGLCGFGYPAAENCTITKNTISGVDQVGGMIGYMWVGHIEGCTVTGNTVTATSERAGGLIGKIQISSGNLGNSKMWVDNNTVSGTVSAPDFTGGIAAQIMGDVDYYSIKNNTISVTSANGSTGVFNAIGNLRASQNAAFTGALAKNITGNWWENASLNADSYQYTNVASGVSAQTIYRGVATVTVVDTTTAYKTLAAAVEACPTDGTEATITMIADETILGNAGVTIPAGKEIILDLNGHTIQNLVNEDEGSQVLLNYGTLTIKDSTDTNKDGIGTGLITNSVAEGTNAGDWWTTPQYNYVTNVITNCGTLTIESGKLYQAAEGTICYAVDNQSSNRSAILNVKGGLLSAYGTAVRMVCGSTTNENTLTMTDGTLSAGNSGLWVHLPGNDASTSPKATLNISGGTLEGDSYAFYDYSYGNAYENVNYTISGGTFEGGIFSYGANITISDGTFNGDVAIKQAKAASELSVTGGTFNGEVYNYGTYKTDPFITGGTFKDVSYEAGSYVYGPYEAGATVSGWTEAQWAASSYYTYTKNQDGTWTLTESYDAYNHREGLAKYVADGYIVCGNTDADTKDDYEFTVAKAVARIGGTYYSSLADALKACKAGETVTLLENIDLSGVEWTPVANFAGTFDGDGHTISNLTASGASNVGFIGSASDATVKNVTLKNANITGTGSNVAALIGAGFRCNIDNVHVLNSTVTAENGAYVAGIVGGIYTSVTNSSVENCTILGKDQVGGVIGYICGASVSGCTVSGTSVTATSERAGVLVGKINIGDSGTQYFNNNTISGTATAPDMAGGIAAQIMGGDADFEIKNNTIDATLVFNKGVTDNTGEGFIANPIGALRPGQKEAFNGALAANITGNWWTDAMLEADSFDYVTSNAGTQTIVRGVAKIGDTSYKTLAAAFTAVKENETIKLIADCETGAEYKLNNMLALDKAGVTLDLNGKTITTTNNFSLMIAADNITVKNGTINAGANKDKDTKINSYAIAFGAKAEGAKVTGIVVDNVTMHGGLMVGGDSEKGTEYLGGASVIIKNCDITSGDFYCVYGQVDSDIVIESGKYKAVGPYSSPAVTNESGTLTVKGGIYSTNPTTYVADGYIAIANTDTNTNTDYPYTVGLAVAQIGDVKYTTLADAFAAAEDGDEIVVIADCTETGLITFPVDKTLTLNLNGHTVNAIGDNTGHWAYVNGNLTVKGSGYLGDTTHEKVGYLFYVFGTLTIEGDAKYESGLEIAEMRAEGSKLYIKGGYFVGDTYDSRYWNFNKLDTYKDSALIEVTGGQFENFDPSNANTESPVQNWVKEGYFVTSATVGENTVYTVAKAVAQIGDTIYSSLEDAISAAVNGNTIVVLADIDLDNPVTVNKGADVAITLDLNGHTISKIDGLTAACCVFDINSDFTVTDNTEAKNGKVIYTKTNETTIWVGENVFNVNDGDFVIEAGNFEFTTTGCKCYASYVVNISNNWCKYCGHASATINGGTFKSTNGDAVIRVHDQKKRNDEITLTVNGGTFTGGEGDAVVWLDVQGDNGGVNTSKVNVYLNGGTFTAADGQQVLDFGSSTGSDASGIKVEINGGKYFSNAAQLMRVRSISDANLDKIVVNGGIFNKTGVYRTTSENDKNLSDFVAKDKIVINTPDDVEGYKVYKYSIGLKAVEAPQTSDEKIATVETKKAENTADTVVKGTADAASQDVKDVVDEIKQNQNVIANGATDIKSIITDKFISTKTVTIDNSAEQVDDAKLKIELKVTSKNSPPSCK